MVFLHKFYPFLELLSNVHTTISNVQKSILYYIPLSTIYGDVSPRSLGAGSIRRECLIIIENLMFGDINQFLFKMCYSTITKLLNELPVEVKYIYKATNSTIIAVSDFLCSSNF